MGIGQIRKNTLHATFQRFFGLAFRQCFITGFNLVVHRERSILPRRKSRMGLLQHVHAKEEIFLVNISLLIQGGTLYPDGSVWLHVLGICIGHVHQARKSNQEIHLFSIMASFNLSETVEQRYAKTEIDNLPVHRVIFLTSYIHFN